MGGDGALPGRPHPVAVGQHRRWQNSGNQQPALPADVVDPSSREDVAEDSFPINHGEYN